MEYRKELQDYIDTVVSREGSDLHLMVNSKPLFRVKKDLAPFIQKEVLKNEDVISLLEIMLDSRIDNVEKYLDENKHLLFSYKNKTRNERDVNFRVNAYLERGNVAIAMRLVDDTERTIEELSLPSILKNVMNEPNGLFLIVGPAGSGKSTSLTAMINYCNNTYRKHILTIEDPVEFIYKNKKSVISQREVPADEVDFRAGIDSALRADADILMIGEMRKVETMSAVMTASEIGHLVLSTIHSSDAVGVIHRIIDSFPSDRQNQIANQLSNALLGVCSIRLLPAKGGGLIPACEIMFKTNAVANLIREGRFESLKTAIQSGSEEGMISLEKALSDLVKRDKISLEVAKSYSQDERTLMRYI